jgi:hypothetical protein
MWNSPDRTKTEIPNMSAAMGRVNFRALSVAEPPLNQAALQADCFAAAIFVRPCTAAPENSGYPVPGRMIPAAIRF